MKDTHIIYSGKYDWLYPDLTRNTMGQYIPILLVVLIILTPYVPERRFSPNLYLYHIIYLLQQGYYIMYIFPRYACDTGYGA